MEFFALDSRRAGAPHTGKIKAASLRWRLRTFVLHSQGLPRLINTICENALIAAYARQMRSVSPDIVDDIATDFRLGVHTPQVGEKKASDELDVRQATKIMLELYARLQAEKVRKL